MPALPLHVGVVLVAVFITAVTDIWKFKVNNFITLPLLVTGWVYHGVYGDSTELAGSILGSLFGFGILIVFCLAGGMGAGDVKLMAAVGAWLGIPFIFFVFLATALAAGVYALVLLLVYRPVSETSTKFYIAWLRLMAVGKHLAADDRIETEVGRDDRRSRVIPFAAMIACGVVASIVLAWIGSR